MHRLVYLFVLNLTFLCRLPEVCEGNCWCQLYIPDIISVLTAFSKVKPLKTHPKMNDNGTCDPELLGIICRVSGVCVFCLLDEFFVGFAY